MKTVYIGRDVFQPLDSWPGYQGESVTAILRRELGTYPEGARLYHKALADDHDVTPIDAADVAALADMPGPFYLAMYPGTGIEIALAVGLLLTASAAIFLRPKIPAVQNQQTGSPNNSLSDRQNNARLGQRIPDIFGQVRATPDLVQLPYKFFDAQSNEIELSYMVISRGYGDVEDVREDTTLVDGIVGESVEVYAPFTSPNSGDAPQLTIGSPIGMGLVTAIQCASVTGQTLVAPNYKRLGTECADIYFTVALDGTGDGICNLESSTNFNFTKYFEDGDLIAIVSPTYVSSPYSVNVTGVYTVGTSGAGQAVQDKTMRLLNCTSVTTDWSNLVHFSSGRTPHGAGPVLDAYDVDPLLGTPASRWTGPFIMDDPDLTGLLNNFVAPNGLYKTDGNNSAPFPVTVEIGLTPVDGSGSPTGPEVLSSWTLPASGVDRTQKALSTISSVSGRTSVRVHRTTMSDLTYQGTVVDTVNWRDMYGTIPVDAEDFGNVTTVQVKTRVNAATASISNRKLSMLFTRRLPMRDGDGFSGTLAASKNVADIFCAVALDPVIGRRQLDEVNVAQIYDTAAAIADYFGFPEAAEFGYTFDDDQMSAEEMLDAIATAVFCTPIRRGSVLELLFEKETDDSALLFNHRNKVPGSEKRSWHFGNLDNYDGVELTYADSANYDVKATYRIPVDGSAVNPMKVDTVGVRMAQVAYIRAWREWNKIRYQRLVGEFSALDEGALVSRTDRILVADNTRPGTQDGEVVGQSGLTLTLSQKVVFQDGTDYLIMLQIPNGTVDVIPVSAGASPKTVILGHAPSGDLSVDIRSPVRAAYWILPDVDNDLGKAFLVSTKGAAESFTYAITAVNYDARYYTNDLDFAG